MITYDDFKKEVYKKFINGFNGEISNEEALSFLKKEDSYIEEAYDDATNENKYRNLYGKRDDFEEMLNNFKNGNYIESDISGTVYGLRMMYE